MVTAYGLDSMQQICVSLMLEEGSFLLEPLSPGGFFFGLAPFLLLFLDYLVMELVGFGQLLYLSFEKVLGSVHTHLVNVDFSQSRQGFQAGVVLEFTRSCFPETCS